MPTTLPAMPSGRPHRTWQLGTAPACAAAPQRAIAPHGVLLPQPLAKPVSQARAFDHTGGDSLLRTQRPRQYGAGGYVQIGQMNRAHQPPISIPVNGPVL